jgi:acylaminoacyl-peptidase
MHADTITKVAVALPNLLIHHLSIRQSSRSNNLHRYNQIGVKRNAVESTRLFIRPPATIFPMRNLFGSSHRAAFLLLIGATSFSLALAQNTAAQLSTAPVGQILAGLSRGRYIGQVAISPDGKRLAWSQRGQFQVAPYDNLSQSQPITVALEGQSCGEFDLTWSPDSSTVAFLSDCAEPSEQDEVYIYHFDGSPARRLTTLHGDVSAPAFAPDGKHIAFLYVEGATRPVGAVAAQELPSGVIGQEDRNIQRVAMVPADTPQPAPPTMVSPADLHVYEFDWSPDSRSVAYIAADPPGENNWWVARLYTQPVGGSPSMILRPSDVPGPLHGLQIAVPRWSPDGKNIAFIGGLMSDQGVTGGDVWVVPSSGGAPSNITPNRPFTSVWIAWDGSSYLIVSEIAGGNCRINHFPVGVVETAHSVPAEATLLNYPGAIGAGRAELSLSITADRSLLVFRASSFSKAPEIFSVRRTSGSASSTQLTHFNDTVKPTWGQSVSLTWANDDFHIQGWLTLPVNYDPSKKYPMIVEVHGGPASAELSRWGMGGPLSPAVFSELGYFVLQPNPRGSYGEGEAFTQANRKDFGYGDLRDILAGVDAVLGKYPVDPHRIGITGWSYGGFMTMFAVTQTHRFRAAVAGAGISDWLSYYGENSIDQWMIPYFGASVYDDPQVYARSSAINFIKNVNTPTLSVVGDRDGECPAPQSFEFWHALRDLGVPTQLVVYPNEGHGFSNPAHSRDVLQRAADWFAKFMPPS